MSLTARLALRGPVIVGLNVTLMMHDCLGGSDVPQVGVCPKSLGSAPLIVIPVIDSVWLVLVLVSVTITRLLVVPTC